MIFWAVPIGWILGYFACLAYSANKGWAYVLFAIAMFVWQVIVVNKYDGGKRMNNRRRLRSKVEFSLYEKGLLYAVYITTNHGVEFVDIHSNDLESYKEKYKHDLHMLIGPEEDEKCE